MIRWLALLAIVVLPASAEVLISHTGVAPPDGEPPASEWVFDELALATGTSGSCVVDEENPGHETCTLTCKGEDDKVEGCMLYLPFTGGDVQLIACSDGFTGTTDNFSAAAVGVGQDGDRLDGWSSVVKHTIGRISAKWRPTGGGDVVVTQGDDSDTETCWATTYKNDQTETRHYVSSDPIGDPAALDWRLIGGHSDVQLADPFRGYLHVVSNADAEAVTVVFRNVQVSNEITIIFEPDLAECEDLIDNADPEDTLIDMADPGCAFPGDDDETDVPGTQFQCSDLEDNDGDGLIDFGIGPSFDPDCDSENDNDESPDQPPPPPGTNLDETFTGNWQPTEDLVFGYDFRFAPGTPVADRSGVFNSDSDYPPDFPGNKLTQVNTDWGTLEPSQGQYQNGGAFTTLKNQINNANYDGAMLNIRYSVWDQSNSPGQRTAPNWICGGNPDTWNEGNQSWGGHIVTVDITQSCVQDGLADLFAALDAAGVPDMPKLKFVILHGPSESKGEEWSGICPQNQACRNAMKNIVTMHADAFDTTTGDDNVWKLGWPKHQEDELYAHAVGLGVGQRNSAAEVWGGATITGSNGNGQYLHNATGGAMGAATQVYLYTDESIVFIAENRHFQDQNEQYTQGSANHIANFGPEKFWPMRYRQANFRQMQMLRNHAWQERNSRINPKMLNWMSLEFGKQAGNASDAWVALQQSKKVIAGTQRNLNNIERWIYQRDTGAGCATTPTTQQLWGFAAVGNAGAPNPNDWFTYVARTGTKICLAIDNDFMVGGPHDIRAKVTYFDDSNAAWSLKYTKSGGGVGTKNSTETQNTGRLRTQTFDIPDFTAPASGFDADFTLEAAGGNVDFVFVRVLKCAAPHNCN